MSTRFLRPIRVEDLPAIYELHQRQVAALGEMGQGLELPNPFEPHIFQVAVGEVDGKVIGAAFFEAEVEVQFISDNPDFVKLMREEQDMMENSLRLRNYKMLRAHIPIGLGQIGAMRRKGFTHMNPKWNCFAKAL